MEGNDAVVILQREFTITRVSMGTLGEIKQFPWLLLDIEISLAGAEQRGEFSR